MRYRGSFTIEAALIMPMILGIIVLFIYIAMFAHDRCAIEYVCETACAMSVYEKGQYESHAKDYAIKGLSDRLILKWDTDVRSYSDELNLYTEIEASSPVVNRLYIYKARANKHFCPKY